MIDFTQLTEKLPYPVKLKARLSTYHADIISYAIANFKDNNAFKLSILHAMNTISYILINGDSMPQINGDDPLNSLPDIDDDLCETALEKLYICNENINWDVEESSDIFIPPTQNQKPATMLKQHSILPTSKEDLYIKPPVVPMFDTSKPWLNIEKDGILYTIYTTLPIIPETQRDISVTTNVSLMTKTNLINLYPNQFIKTRASCMYDELDGLEFNEMLGIIIPIDGFSSEQIRNNIIKYPHLYKLKRKINDELINFHSHIEINGILHKTLDIWDSLPESKMIPKTADFIKEYVVRRYLLERDELKIKHKYPLFGSLDPFLTLFTTPADYQKLGTFDVEELARKCVSARVQYLQSRNPILRTVYDLP